MIEIDYHSQSKYSPGEFQLYIEIDGKVIRETSFNEIENVIRDISFVRHQSKNFLFLYGGQFDFERMLRLPYWDFLFIKGDINEIELLDIQDGCLLILALLFFEIYDDNSSSYIHSNQLYDQLDKTLNLFKPTTDRQKIIIEKIKYLRKHVDDYNVSRHVNVEDGSLLVQEEIENCNQFLYKELIENYYCDVAKSFEIFRQKITHKMKQIIGNQKPI